MMKARLAEWQYVRFWNSLRYARRVSRTWPNISSGDWMQRGFAALARYRLMVPVKLRKPHGGVFA